MSTAHEARRALQASGINVRHTISERDGLDLLELETPYGTVWIQPQMVPREQRARLSIELAVDLEGRPSE